MRIFILLLLVVGVHSAIQLDDDCLKNPSKCDDDAFSVAEFTICSGDIFPEVDGASKGTGNRAKGCSLGEDCTMVFPTDEFDNKTWGTNVTKKGCTYLKYHGQNPTQSKLDMKIEACKKWLSKDVGVCQGAIWVPIVSYSLGAALLIALVLVAIYIKYPDMLPASISTALNKMKWKKTNKYERLPRNF